MAENENPDDAPIPTIDEPSPPAKSCALCGCSTPAVRCDRCSSQIFCLSCDDMYHRHPKRKLHLRKAVDSIWNSSKSPRLRRRTELPGDPSKIPIPPPRSKKRERHTVGGGRLFLKQSHELGSFGHSKMFDLRTIAPPPKDIFAGQKTSPNKEGTYENETSMDTTAAGNIAAGNDIYENENIPMNTRENIENSNSMGQVPWNMPRTNISSPIQVSIPSTSPDMIANGQSFGYPMKPQSRSIADLTGAPPPPIGPHPFHLPHYPYMHPHMHPQYSHSTAHLNCAQCMSSSWSNLMSPHPSPYFHPMPWGSLARGVNGKHGSVPSFPDPNFHFPYPGGAFYPNGAPVMDPNFLPQQAPESQKVKRSRSGSRHTQSPENPENMEITTDSAPEVRPEENPAPREVNRRKSEVDEEPPKIPDPPSKPWSCLHCTYVNPPGIHICEVCCKTSYGNTNRSENQNEGRSFDSRNSDSPMELVNLDALSQSPDFIKHRVQKDEGSIGADSLETEEIPDIKSPDSLTKTPEPTTMLTTETQTSTTTKTTDAQTQNLVFQSIDTSTDSIFPKQEISVQTETETTAKNCSVATDPMISSQSMESLMSGFSAPPYQNRRAGWGRGACFSTQSLYERGQSKSPIPRSLSEAQSFVRDSSLPPEEAMHSWSQAWLGSDPMYFKPQGKEDYFDGTWGSMDKLNRRVKSKQGKKFEVGSRPKFHRSLDDLKAEKTQDIVHSRELQFLQTVKEAERCGFSLEDLHVAYLLCGKENPVFWLEDNWSFMIKNVIALAAKYGEDNEENDVGVITASEAKNSLHIHRGDIWDAVTECIENRQRKILELTVRGNFTQKQISDALKNNEGNVELAYADLLRASTRRHKFILSPGLSEDSEYNPVDESTADHNVSVKAGKLDVPTDSKADKKKSDFLTKLSAIRQAQSERRKAREEKEIIRETTTQDTPETGIESPVSEVVDVKNLEEISHQDPITEEPVGDIEKEIADAELEFDAPSIIYKSSSDKKEDEDIIPEDYDTNWVESQGEWIEEYSDEQWDEEGDSQWVSLLQKKYQSMEKEFEDEAKQMAALWEKEELEDDVFEEEPKEVPDEEVGASHSDAERVKQEQDEKFQQWVKVNLEQKSLSETEENEPNDQKLKLNLSKEPSLSRSVEFDDGLLCKSPLQHYPTEFDLSMKADPDWIELDDVDVAEKDKIDVEVGKNVEDVLQRENIDPNMENSDEDWEKIDLEIEMLDEKKIEYMTKVPVEDIDSMPSVDQMYNKTHSLDRTLEHVQDTVEGHGSSVVTSAPEATELSADKPREVARPKPPVRRKSKLNTAAIEEVLKSRQTPGELSPDVPPALPLKRKDKSPENTSKDLYAVPDKHKPRVEEKLQTEIIPPKPEKMDAPEVPAPMKPPRVNLSPSMDIEAETGEKKSINSGFSKDASPVTSLSNESDSNCFADSESDPEIKIIRQKYMHRKAAKYENEEDDLFDDVELPSKLEESGSPSDLRKEVELQSKAFEFDPELPIPIGTRGSRVVEIDEVESPKAFREGTARPLQLFKVTKQSSTEMTPEHDEQNKDIDTMVSGIVKAYHEHVSEIPSASNVASESLPSESKVADNQRELYASEAQLSYQNIVDPNYYNTSAFEQPLKLQNIQESARAPEGTPETHSTISDSILPIEPIPEEPLPISYEESPKNEEEEELEMKSASAAADYFFGRYNEVTVTKPKKRATIVKNAKVSTPAAPKVMSASEIAVPPVSQPSAMEKSASPVMMQTSIVSEDAPPATSLPAAPPQKAPRSPKAAPPPEPEKEPEYLPFADDYFFGSYNEVVVPKKGKKKIPPKPIPKIQEKAKVEEAVSPEASQTISSSSAVSSVLQHAESTTSLYFDTSSLMEDTFYLAEMPEQPADNVSLSSSDRKGKSVHFVDPQPAVVPPPRKNRPKPVDSNQSSVSSYTPAADEFMYEQYGKSSPVSVVDKKKLQSSSEDFKLNQEYDPSNFPCDSFLQPSDQPESDISSEISLCTSKEPSDAINSMINGPFGQNREHELSEEFLSHELSDNDNAKNIVVEQTSLSPDLTVVSDSVNEYLKLEEHFSENKKPSEISPNTKFFKEDSLNATNYIPTDNKNTVSDLVDQNIVVEGSIVQSPFEISSTLEDFDVSKEIIIVEPEISKAEIGALEKTQFSSNTEETAQADLKAAEDKNVDIQITPHNISEDITGTTERDISDGHSPVSDILISDSYTVKLESGSVANRILDDEEMERDTYSVHMDDDFEDGLLLVEEAENLINEFCDIYPPGIFDLASPNEIQNLNTKNNKQESTYDSEHEWKLNEERYNSLNANFIENKLYKSKGSPEIADDKESLIIDTKSSVEGVEVSDISLDASTSDLGGLNEDDELAGISDISELARISDIGELTGNSGVGQLAENSNIVKLAETSNLGEVAESSNIDELIDCSNLGELAETSSIGEDLLTVSNKGDIYSEKVPTLESESATENCIISQTTSESMPTNIIQPLSILCQEACSTVDFEPTCSKSLSLEGFEGATDEEESEYSKSELIDVSFDLSDESLVTSTRSSISTQIPVPSDVRIQDLVDELDYEMESKTPVQTSVEEHSGTLDMSLKTDDLDQADSDLVTEKSDVTLSASPIIDHDTHHSSSVEMDTVIQDRDDENIPVESDNITITSSKSELIDVSFDLSDESLVTSTRSSISTQIPVPSDVKIQDLVDELDYEMESKTLVQTSFEEHSGTLDMSLKTDDRDQADSDLVTEKSDVTLSASPIIDHDTHHSSSVEMDTVIQDRDDENIPVESDNITPTSLTSDLDINVIEDNLSTQCSVSRLLSTHLEKMDCDTVVSTSQSILDNKNISMETEDSNGEHCVISSANPNQVEVSEDQIKIEQTVITAEKSHETEASQSSTILSDSSELSEREINDEDISSLKDKLTESETDEVHMEENIEDSCESLMSHFYDEWIQDVKESQKSSILLQDVRSKYAAYYNYAESSNSESASENEEFMQTDTTAISNLESQQIESSLEESKTSVIDDGFIRTSEQFKNQNICTSDSDIEIKTFDEQSSELLKIDKQEDSYEVIIKEQNIEISTELSDVIYKELDILESNNQIIKNDGVNEKIFTTTKSCQTDDSFEEDQFFDSFDDPLMDPTLYLPIDKKVNLEPVTVEIGIQCHIITSEVVSNSDKNLQKPEIKTFKSEEIQVGQGTVSIYDELNDSEFEEVILPGVITLTKEDSSFEISEDSDSDIFLEPQSSHDDPKSNNSFLCAEIDSGFSSGSDCGKRTEKHVTYTDGLTITSSTATKSGSVGDNIPDDEVKITGHAIKHKAELVSEVSESAKEAKKHELSEESTKASKITVSTSNKQVNEATKIASCASTSQNVQIKENTVDTQVSESKTVVEEVKTHELSEESEKATKKTTSKSNEKISQTTTKPSSISTQQDVSIKKDITDVNILDTEACEVVKEMTAHEEESLQSVNLSISNSNNQIKKAIKDSVGTSTFQNVTVKEDVSDSEACDIMEEEDIYERAVTPISIEKVPSIDDLTFIELKTDITEQAAESESIVHLESCSTPTVEYFYGALPATVMSTIPSEDNDYFVEALDLLDASASEHTKHHVDNVFASLSNDSSISKSDINDSEDLSESLSSFHEFDDDSLTESASEYFLPSDNEDKATLKNQVVESTAKNVSEFKIASSSKTSHVPTSFDQHLDSKTKSEVGKSGKEHSSSTLCQRTVKEVIDEKSNEANESLSVEPDSLNETDKACDASEFEDSLYLESASEYSLPADTLSKLSEKVTLSITKDDSSLVPQEECQKELSKTNDTFEVPTSLSTVQIKEQDLQPHIPIFNDETHNKPPVEALPEFSSSNVVQVSASQTTCVTTQANFSEKIQAESDEIDVPKPSEIEPKPFNDEKIKVPVDLPLSSSAADQSLYLESIQDYFTSETVSTNSEKIESSLDSPNIPEKMTVENMDKILVQDEKLTIVNKNDQSLNFERDLTTLSTSEAIEEELKITSYKSDLPPVPSDIVRYLYYGDDITFEEDSSAHEDTSFNSAHNTEPISDSVIIHSDNSFQSLDSELKDFKEKSEDAIKNILPLGPSEGNCPELISQDVQLSSEEQIAECQSIQTFSSGPEGFKSAHSGLESTDQWYELDSSKHLPVHEARIESVPKSESSTETNSLTKEDGESPCIPELILDHGARDIFPAAKLDSDEVTDISSHFTMTEDGSDNFSDIESDSSLQDFETDCGFLHDFQSKNGVEVQENVKEEADDAACSNDHKELSPFKVNTHSSHENASQEEVFLDSNSNENIVITPPQVSALREEIYRERLEDSASSVKDFNGNVTESPVGSTALETIEHIPPTTEKVSNEHEQEFGIPALKEGESISSLKLQIPSTPSITKTLEDEFCDISQTTESCYTSPLVEPDNWLDASNDSIFETEGSDFVMPHENIDSVLTPENNLTIASTVILSEKITQEVSNVGFHQDIVEQKDDMKENGFSISNIENATEHATFISQIASNTEANVLNDIKINEVLEEMNPLSSSISSKPVQEFTISDLKEVESISSLESHIPSSSSITETLEDEFCDISQTTESCYTSPLVETDNWLDANNDNILETKGSDFVLPNEYIVNALTTEDNIPIDSTVILSEIVPLENISNVDFQQDIVKQKENYFSISNIENTTEHDGCSTFQIASNTEPIVSNDIKRNEVPEETNAKQVLESSSPESKQPFVNYSFSFRDIGVNEMEFVEDKKAIFEPEVKSENEVFISDALGPVVIPEGESRNPYETKERKIEDLPKDSDALPSVVSKVIETECGLNFGNEEGISVPFESYVCHEVQKESVSQSEPELSTERVDTSHDFISSDAVDNSSVLRGERSTDLVQQEETFSFSKFGYLIKDGKLPEPCDSVCETSDSPLNVDLLKYVEEKTISESDVVSCVDKLDAFLETDTELLEESEQNIITMGQISTVLYPKTDDKQHTRGKEHSHLVEHDYFDNLQEDSFVHIQHQDISTTNANILKEQTPHIQEFVESLSTSAFITAPDESQLNGNVQNVLPLESNETSIFIEQIVQEATGPKESVTDASLCTFSGDSDCWHEEDFLTDKASGKSLNQNLVDASKQMIQDQIGYTATEEKQHAGSDGIEYPISSDSLDTIPPSSLDILGGNFQKEPSSTVEPISYSETESVNFHSACDNFDNASVITSDEDFTDVASHFTLTEGSEAFSDVETDVSTEFDDCEDHSFSELREETPTRETGGYTFRDEDFYSFKGDLVNETTKDYPVENLVPEIKVSNEILDNECSIFKAEHIQMSESSTKQPKSEDQLPECIPSQSSESVLEKDIVKESFITIDDSSKNLNQETNVSFIETTNDDTQNAPSSVALQEDMTLDKLEKTINEQVLISHDNLETNINSFKVDTEIAIKKENEEEYTNFGNEVSGQSSHSVFQTVSKDDESETFSEVESEIYGEPEESLSKDDDKQQSQNDFIPFAEESGKATVKRNKTSKKVSTVFDIDKSSEVQNSFNDINKYKNEISETPAEYVSIRDGKRTLSLSIADIVEASDLQQKTDETTETLLLEHFADIKSLSEPLATAEIFSTFEPDIAVLKMHEDVGDVSLHLEMTEDSDYWLEAETEYSISEFEDEAVSLSVKDMDDPFEMDVNNLSDHHIYATSSQYSDATGAGISTNFYTDTEYSDQMSDTCADISLQGATTESSDKWSDIEGDAAIDEALYGLAHSAEPNKEGLDVTHRFSPEGAQDGKRLLEVKIDSDQLPELALAETLKKEELVIEKKDCSETKILLLPLASERSSDSASENYTQPLSDPLAGNISASGLSDDFTSVTPLDVTADELDKWSDISDDLSPEELQHDSKLTPKKCSTPPKVTLDVSSEVISVQASKEVVDSESGLPIKDQPQADITLPGSNINKVDQTLELVSEIKDCSVSKIPEDVSIDKIEILKMDAQNTKSTISSLSNVDTENVIYEELTLDTIKEDVSETETPGKELPKTETDVDETDPLSIAPAFENEDYENYDDNFEGYEYPEGEEYDPNIDENGMEFEEEDYPDESVPYIENEDELVYPLQTEDWIEESFDLKEYGVEYGMSGSETDVHGYGVNDEYEDMQRAIDFNLSNFDDVIDENLTTESFKTLSSATPTQSKLTEHESWSTADAESINDDLPDHDDVLSKIDELLAEDFAYDHTDYYRDDVSSDFLGDENKSFTPIEDSFKTKDEKIDDFKLTESLTLSENTAGNLKYLAKALENNVEQKTQETLPKSLSDSTTENSSIKKYSEEGNLNIETVIGKSETFAVKEHAQVLLEAEFNTVDNVDSSSSKASSDHLKSLSMKEPYQIESKAILTDELNAKLSSDESKAKMSSDESKHKILSDESKMSNDISEAVRTSDNSKPKISSDELKSKLPSDVTKAKVSSDESIAKVLFDESKTYKAKKLSEEVSENIFDEGSFKTSEQSDTFTIRKLNETASIKSSNEISSEQSESITVKVSTQVLSDATSAVDSNFKITNEKESLKKSADLSTKIHSLENKKLSESDLSFESSKDQFKSNESAQFKEVSTVGIESDVSLSTSFNEVPESMTDPLDNLKTVDTEITHKMKQSLNKEKTDEPDLIISSTSISKKIIDNEVKEIESEILSESKKQEPKIEKALKKEETLKLDLNTECKIEKVSATTIDKPIAKRDTESDILLENKKQSSKIEKKVIKEESPKLDLKTENASATSVDKPIVKKESLKETEIDIPSDNKENIEKTHISKTCASSDQTDAAGQRRRSRITSSQSVEEESVTSKPETKEHTQGQLPSKTVENSSTEQTNTVVQRRRSRITSSQSVEEESATSKPESKEHTQEQLPSKTVETSCTEHTETFLQRRRSRIASSQSVEEENATSKPETKEHLPSKTDETSPTEQTDTFVRRRRSRLASSQAAEDEPAISKPESKEFSAKTVESCTEPSPTDIVLRRRRSRITSQDTEEESTTSKPDIPLKRRRDSTLKESQKASISSPDDQPSDSNTSSSETSNENKSKPDIPEKRKRKPKSEPEPLSQKPALEAPSLPPKTLKRDSSMDSISSSVFLSSSSESLSCYESASLKETSKSETAAEPDVPERKIPVKPRRRESNDDTSSSSINRSSSSRCSYDLPPKESMDLCRKRTSIDERMVKLQVAGKCTTKETAFIAAKLIEMQFEEEDALLASRQCTSIYHAVKFLTQLCELCQCRFPINSMASMIHCAHRACKECLKAHFTNQIYDRSIFTLLCPICQKPDITDQNIQEYFNHLEMMFRNILDSHVYDLFQRKLRDEVLTKDPNFHWCSQCSSGFIASPRLKKLYCPDCSAITCAQCHQTWESEHEGVHCERFQQWKDMHTPEPPPAGLVKLLTDRGITCPSCDLNFAQASAGCLMYKCSHCSFEFCGFCSKPSKRGKDCGNKQCESRGIHAHHPFSCLFFLRDKDVSELQLLLDEESVKYLTIPTKDQIVKSRCQVREQKHIHGSLAEDRCGRDIVPYCAGLCRTHYYEYLAELLRKHKINPLSLMTTHDLEFMLRKSRCPVPEKVKGESKEEFYERLTETVSSNLS